MARMDSGILAIVMPWTVLSLDAPRDVRRQMKKLQCRSRWTWTQQTDDGFVSHVRRERNLATGRGCSEISAIYGPMTFKRYDGQIDGWKELHSSS